MRDPRPLGQWSVSSPSAEENCRFACLSFGQESEAAAATRRCVQSCRSTIEETYVKVMVMVKATKDSEAGVLPTKELLTAMGQFNESLAKAGILLAGEGLKPSRFGKRVHFSGRNRVVTDGPFAETKELVAGYWLWQVSSIEEAVEWVKRCPNPMLTDSDIDIRPIYELEDFAGIITDEAKAQEQDLRQRTPTWK
jgi:hypothetical protein